MIYSKFPEVKDKEAIINFKKHVYPYRKEIEKYVDFTVYSLSKEALKESLLIYDDDKLIGTNMALPFTVLTGEKEHQLIWTYDTIILNEYRNSQASELFTSILYKRKDYLGAGLSKIAEEMQKKMKAKFIAFARLFIKVFPIRSFFYVLKIGHHKTTKYPSEIICKDIKYKKINSILEIDKLNFNKGSYWNNTVIEPSRSKEFIKWRFFNSTHDYQIYVSQKDDDKNPNFFVTRIIKIKGLNFLFLIDYRFDLENKKEIYNLFMSVEKLAKKINCCGIITRSSLKKIDSILNSKFYFKKKSGAQIVTRYKPLIESQMEFFFTPADSDSDFK